MRRHCASIAICLLLLAGVASASDFATELVTYSGPFGGEARYGDPNSVLGKPATEIYDREFEAVYKASLVYAAFNVDPNDGKLVTTIGGDGAYITVRFDHRVVDHPGNWYGRDFIVYGNAFFRHSSSNTFAYHDTNMDTFLLHDGTAVTERVQVSVSSDGNNWYTYDTGPYGDSLFPTNAYGWDSDSNSWGEELDWTKPVDPNLTSSDFNGLTAAAAIELYDGSAGGTSFDLAEATGLDTIAIVLPDGNTVLRQYLQYIRVSSPGGFYINGEIDAFSDVAVVPGYYPPRGDVNGDGNVDNLDISPFVAALTVDQAAFVALFPDGEYWAADVGGDGNVDNLDITPFVDLMTGGGSPVPEPASVLLVAVGAAGALIRRRR